MTNGRHDESLIKPSGLDEKQSFEWRHLSMQTVLRRLEPRCSNMNETLEFAARREPQSPVAPVYRIWMADNLAHDGRFAEAIVGYDAAIRAAESTPPLFERLDGVATALSEKAQAATLARDPDLAIATYRELGERVRARRQSARVGRSRIRAPEGTYEPRMRSMGPGFRTLEATTIMHQ